MKRKITLIGFILLVMCSLIFTWIHFNKEPLNFDHVWSEVTVPYGSSCNGDCITIKEQVRGGHGSDIKLVVNPAIDDPVAQWGDCVGSIMTCYEAGAKREDFDQHKDATMHTCIMESICPLECRAYYEAEVNGDMSQVNTTLEDVFLGERAACLPTEAWIE